MDLFRLDLKTLEFLFEENRLGEKIEQSVYFQDQDKAHELGKLWISQDVHHVYGVVKI